MQVGTTKSFNVIRSAGDSVELRRWEFRDAATGLYCPLPPTVSATLTQCQASGGQHCTYTVGDVHYAATVRSPTSMQERNEATGKTRELRLITLCAGSRVVLPGWVPRSRPAARRGTLRTVGGSSDA